MLVRELLTHSALFYLLCCNPKDGKDFSHDLNNHVHHFRRQRHFCVHFKPPEKHFDALKNVQKSFLARSNVFRCLTTVCVRMTHARAFRIHTERRTPIPAKTTVVGENACKINVSVDLE